MENLEIEIQGTETFLKDLDEIKSLDLLKYNSVNETFNKIQNKFVEIIDEDASTHVKKETENQRRNHESLKVSSSLLKLRYVLQQKKQDHFRVSDLSLTGAKSDANHQE